MTVLMDIRQHLIDAEIVTASGCKLNQYDTSNEFACLWQYGGFPTDIGQKPTIQISVYSLSHAAGEAKINAIFNELINDNPCKYKLINNQKMWINANQQPFYLEKDEQKRHIFIFNITVTTKR
jgi:hypothetical protein